MKTHLLLFAFVCFFVSSLFGQLKLRGDTYALIIGVSDYAHPEIEDLEFAHRDASIFKEYLLSKSGGQVPPEKYPVINQ